MKKIIMTILILSSLALSGCGINTNEDRVLEDDKWIEDINYLDENMKRRHPNLFNSISSQQWDESIDELKKDVGKLSDKSISLRIIQIISAMKDGHTTINMLSLLSPIGEDTIPFDEVIAFPIKCAYFEDGIRVVKCDREYKEILGYKLLSINGIDIKEVITKLYTLTSYDNEQDAKERARAVMNVYDFLEFLEIVDNDEAEYAFEDNKGNIVKLDIKAQKGKSINYIDSQYPKFKTDEKPNGESDFYWMKYFEEDNILYFKYDSCLSDEQNNYFDFEEKLIDKINNINLNKLVIDLRYNRGGRIDYTNSLISELKNSTNLEGYDIVVISGKATFSAATLLTWNLQSILGATVIGEETGGNVNSFEFVGDELLTMTLPNSGLVINYPTSFRSTEKDYTGGVKPDIEIIQSYESYKNGIDDCYEYVKKFIGGDTYDR